MFLSLRKADILLFFFFLASAALIAAAPLASPPVGEVDANIDRVKITCCGEEYGIYPLEKDAEIEISRDDCTNLVLIHDGTVEMEYSSCKNQICVFTGAISRPGELIVCLPNQIIVEIEGSKEGGEDDEQSIDAVAR